MAEKNYVGGSGAIKALLASPPGAGPQPYYADWRDPATGRTQWEEFNHLSRFRGSGASRVRILPKFGDPNQNFEVPDPDGISIKEMHDNAIANFTVSMWIGQMVRSTEAHGGAIDGQTNLIIRQVTIFGDGRSSPSEPGNGTDPPWHDQWAPFKHFAALVGGLSNITDWFNWLSGGTAGNPTRENPQIPPPRAGVPDERGVVAGMIMGYPDITVPGLHQVCCFGPMCYPLIHPVHYRFHPVIGTAEGDPIPHLETLMAFRRDRGSRVINNSGFAWLGVQLAELGFLIDRVLFGRRPVGDEDNGATVGGYTSRSLYMRDLELSGMGAGMDTIDYAEIMRVARYILFKTQICDLARLELSRIHLGALAQYRAGGRSPATLMSAFAF